MFDEQLQPGKRQREIPEDQMSFRDFSFFGKAFVPNYHNCQEDRLPELLYADRIDNHAMPLYTIYTGVTLFSDL
jgi:hypothetical protein